MGMRRRNLTLILVTVLVFFSACKKQSGNLIYDKEYIDEIKAAREQMVLYLSRNGIPGASIAVAKNGQLIYSEGMGWASKEHEVNATRHTKFRIGELSELFTSFIYLRMIQEGKLHPDSTIQTYMPDFPEKEQELTLKHLAYQTSGLRETTLEEKSRSGLNTTLQKGLDSFKNDPLHIAPDLYQIKSIYNYNLLGAIIEKTNKSTFRNILKDYITDTLKLSNTLTDNPQRIIKNRSDFYDQNFVAQALNAREKDLRYSAPSMGILSNAEDLVKFGNEVFYGDLLSEETKKTMFYPIPLYENMPSEMANGWMLYQNRKGQVFYGKSGMIIGGSASLLIYPDYGIVIACTSNLSNSSDDTPIFDIAGIFMGKE
jgi:serine beta-lactamase-like protein LACTB